jgi:hypothetical protein
MKTRFVPTVARIRQNQQGLVEKHLFGLGLAHSVLVDVFSRVARIPVESDYS